MTIDYCLKNADEAEFNKLMLATGLCVEVTEGEGKEAVTTIVPASYEVLIDRIGPITIGETTYPEYYSNLRILGLLNEEQVKQIDPFAIDPSQPQYRVFL
jgi:hypothetical protein